MMLWKIQQRLTYLNKLITLKSTGTPKELAIKLSITERSWYKLKAELVNDLHWPIGYDVNQRSYVYRENVCFEMGFRKLPTDESSQLLGGKLIYPKQFLSHYFLHHFFRF
ncbi:hypothetical protein [Aquirufa sp. ROCK-SH2]